MAVTLKTNRYDTGSDTLQLTAPEAAAYRHQIDYWARYFHDPVENGGLTGMIGILEPVSER